MISQLRSAHNSTWKNFAIVVVSSFVSDEPIQEIIEATRILVDAQPPTFPETIRNISQKTVEIETISKKDDDIYWIFGLCKLYQFT